MSDVTPTPPTKGTLPMSLTAVFAIRTAEVRGYNGAAIARHAEAVAMECGESVVESWHVDDAVMQIVAGLAPDDDCFGVTE